MSRYVVIILSFSFSALSADSVIPMKKPTIKYSWAGKLTKNSLMYWSIVGYLDYQTGYKPEIISFKKKAESFQEKRVSDSWEIRWRGKRSDRRLIFMDNLCEITCE